MHSKAPLYLSCIISVTTPSRYDLRSADGGTLLHCPLIKSFRLFSERALISPRAPRLWNKLPRQPCDIRTTTSHVFRLQQFYVSKLFRIDEFYSSIIFL